MSDFDWKKLIGGIAPVLGSALGGPLAGAAIGQLAAVLLGNPDAPEADVAAALASGRLSGEQVVAIKKAESDFAVRMRELDIDVLKINQAADAALIADTSDARHTFGKDENVFVLGCIILGAFGVLMGLVLTGLFYLMTGKVVVDPGVMTACGTLIGTIVGYVAANAQQVVSFFYGSSKGSKDNGDRIGAALTESIKQAGSK
ncbi:hypothetical protein J7E62_27825 [Variovorax paradoxus]|nr:hypothetical protein [Variovorax paradoxus]